MKFPILSIRNTPPATPPKVNKFSKLKAPINSLNAPLTLSMAFVIPSNMSPITEKSLFASAPVNSSNDLVNSANFLGVTSGISFPKASRIGVTIFFSTWNEFARP